MALNMRRWWFWARRWSSLWGCRTWSSSGSLLIVWGWIDGPFDLGPTGGTFEECAKGSKGTTGIVQCSETCEKKTGLASPGWSLPDSETIHDLETTIQELRFRNYCARFRNYYVRFRNYDSETMSCDSGTTIQKLLRTIQTLLRAIQKLRFRNYVLRFRNYD